MKNLLLALALIVTLSVFTGCQTSQQISDEANQYVVVVDFPDMSSDEIYVAANDWMVSTFRSAESVIEYTDKEDGIITGKCHAAVPMGGIAPADIRFKLTINIREEKARIMMSGMQWADTSNPLYNALIKFTAANHARFVAWADSTIIPSFKKTVAINSATNW